MSKNLVIVESPVKAKALQNYLGKEYSVMASYGHVRDLTTKKWGDKNGIICGLACSFIIYQFIISNFIYSLIGSVIAVISERPKIKWFDDDLSMQIIPITVLVVLNWFDLLPDLVKDGVIIGGGI